MQEVAALRVVGVVMFVGAIICFFAAAAAPDSGKESGVFWAASVTLAWFGFIARGVAGVWDAVERIARK